MCWVRVRVIRRSLQIIYAILLDYSIGLILKIQINQQEFPSRQTKIHKFSGYFSINTVRSEAYHDHYLDRSLSYLHSVF